MAVNISFLMPVLNVDRYIGEAVRSVQDQSFRDWELIVVDDGSDDRTPEILEDLRRGDARIRVVRNRGKGQVQALNTGFAQATGGMIKFIDGDDILSSAFSRQMSSLGDADAFYHDLSVVTSDLRPLNALKLTSKFKNQAWEECFQAGIVHPPRSSWMFSRRIGRLIFPLPDRLPSPHEDFWIAVAIKKHAAKIEYIPEELYLYRQHEGQAYGGIFNFSPKTVSSRARAMLKILDVMDAEADFVASRPALSARLKTMRSYYRLLAQDRLRIDRLLISGLSPKSLAKIFMIKKFPWMAAWLSRMKSRKQTPFLRILK